MSPICLSFLLVFVFVFVFAPVFLSPPRAAAAAAALTNCRVEEDPFESGFRPIRVGYVLLIEDISEDDINKIIAPAMDILQGCLLVVPVPDGTYIKTSAENAFGGSYPQFSIPSLYRETGVEGYDMFFFIYADSSTCGDGTIGFARTVTEDDYGRPIYGAINFCPQQVGDFDGNSASMVYMVGVTVHEMFHALGFSSDGLCKFRDEFGESYADLDANGNCPYSSALCVDGSRKTIQRPSQTIFKQVVDIYGQTAYELTTERSLR